MKSNKNTEGEVVELVGLLSQAIDIIRNHGAEEDANYIETQMENTIQHYKEKSKWKTTKKILTP